MCNSSRKLFIDKRILRKNHKKLTSFFDSGGEKNFKGKLVFLLENKKENSNSLIYDVTASIVPQESSTSGDNKIVLEISDPINEEKAKKYLEKVNPKLKGLNFGDISLDGRTFKKSIKAILESTKNEFEEIFGKYYL